ncbi:phospholipase ABHD3 isoform X1 [Arabidopsis lyrata subsp. lyrata]|uniref:phospholipase ABHD3 isoform X1 n=1 Tax=Arabidopsis lyrata subsp. lyrata TaxID=81972 RepID=UPI000A29DB53|nr:phospholipase ABHD3 isoform X1 [Arabidopsis lyrata subsp. lyrata]|eukprot:XP_020871824.1 phospholipase ABHD3 isoform X1 [Arabidopsis lyrata subsp. lyrata]
MNCAITEDDLISPYLIIFKSLLLIPISHYLTFFFLTILVFLYFFLEIHFPKADPISLTFNPNSEFCQFIVSKCRLLHGRYFPTFWLSSPHLQTAFLSLFGKSPPFSYKRILYQATDGGTIALDWLMHSDVVEGISQVVNGSTSGTDRTPIAIVVPGLTSDSSAAYIKHIAFRLAKEGWNVVVQNHRGLGGISLTSDCVYTAGWTEDLRKVIDHIHSQFPEAPLFAVGTSIGANVLVKYLGEDGPNTPLIGATAVCSPWDLLICDRFINRKLVQKLYDRMLTIGLQGYAQLHHSIISRIADWEGIKKSRSVREFDNYATRLVAKFETTDTYYRRSSSSQYVGNVAVPLLCISALDDPVCTREAIPWDECRANKNIVLATTTHGGHLAYYEGLTATSMWWARAVQEYFEVLLSSSFADRRQKMQIIPEPLGSSIDQGPFADAGEDGMVAAASEVDTTRADVEPEDSDQIDEKTSNYPHKDNTPQVYNSLLGPLKKRVDQLSRYSRKSIWLLAYIAIVTTWPLVGPALLFSIKRRFRKLVEK